MLDVVEHDQEVSGGTERRRDDLIGGELRRRVSDRAQGIERHHRERLEIRCARRRW
jgi:hypothetical protein